MASNLVNEIIRMATPAIIDKVAAAFGINATAARSGLMAAIPTIIGMLANKAGTPTGAKDIFASLGNANPDVIGGLTKALTGAGSASFAQSGTSVLGSLFGESTSSVAANVVGKFAGLDGKSGGSLMGVASQLVLGGLAGQKASSGFDASGLASLLSAQKNNVAEAMPAGLGALLAAAPGLSSSFSGLAGAASSAAQNATAAARAATQSANPMATNAAAAAGGSKWIAWIAALAVIGGGLWYYTQQKQVAPATTTTETTTTQPATTTDGATTTQPATPSLVVDGTDVGKAVTDSLGGLTTLLGTVTDATTAQAALPKLQEGQTAMDGLIAMAAKLSPEQKAALAGQFGPALSSLQAAVAKVMAIPGVGEVLKPAVEGLMAKVVLLAK